MKGSVKPIVEACSVGASGASKKDRWMTQRGFLLGEDERNRKRELIPFLLLRGGKEGRETPIRLTLVAFS